MALNIPDEGHCRNASCSLNLISTFVCSCGDIQLIAYYMYNVLLFVILINKVIIKNSICKEFISLNLQSICHKKRFEDAKGVIRSSLKSNRNRQLNGQSKKDKTDLSLVPLY